MGEVERQMALAFAREAARQGCCQNCGFRLRRGVPGRLEADHVLPKSVLRRLFRQVGAELPPAVVWDVRNARLLCDEPAPNRCHSRWTQRLIDPPPVREAAWEFARELDVRFGGGATPFTAWMERTYGEGPAS